MLISLSRIDPDILRTDGQRLVDTLAKFDIASEVSLRGVVNVKLKEFPHIIVRISDSGVYSLNPHSLKFRKVRYGDLENKMHYIVKKIRERYDYFKALVLDDDERAFYTSVLEWTTSPGRHDVARKLLTDKHSSKYKVPGTVYRGLILSPEELKAFFESDELKHPEFSSWTRSKATAVNFSKGMSMSRRLEEGYFGVVLVKKAKARDILIDVEQVVENNPKFKDIAETGLLGKDLEPATLYLKEVALKPLVVNDDQILELRKYTFGSFKKVKVSDVRNKLL